jgi:hypothetical protein
MQTTRQLPRHRRLYQILERLNRIHCRRRLLGKPTTHLLARCRALSDAWLDSRPI